MAELETRTAERDSLLQSLWWTLKIVFGVVPVVAGLDKFFNLLVAWDKYLAPPIASLIPITPASFMMLVGIVEIVAGLGVLFTPWTRVFAWIVAIWLWCIALDLIVAGFYDIAVRDLVLGISSYCLARLTELVPATAPTRLAARRRVEVHA